MGYGMMGKKRWTCSISGRDKKCAGGTVWKSAGCEDVWVLELPEGHGNCHSADEAQSLENLKQAVEIYVTAIIEVCRWMEKNPQRKTDGLPMEPSVPK